MIHIKMINLIIDKVGRKNQLEQQIDKLILIKSILSMMNQELFKLLAIMNKPDNLNLTMKLKQLNYINNSNYN